MTPSQNRFRAALPIVTSVLVIVLVAAQVICFTLLVPLLKAQGQQAERGQKAAELQCQFRPATAKEQAFFHDRGAITDAEYQAILRVLPSPDCARLLSRK